MHAYKKRWSHFSETVPDTSKAVPDKGLLREKNLTPTSRTVEAVCSGAPPDLAQGSRVERGEGRNNLGLALNYSEN